MWKRILGSVVEEVLRGTVIPVITVRSRDEAPRSTREESTTKDELAG